MPERPPPDQARPGPSSPGRPRDLALGAAALAATRDLLLEVGYGRLSFELVARRAGVSRASLYRRWPAKPWLVFDAAFSTFGPTSVADSGSLEADLLSVVQGFAAEFTHPVARVALAGVLADFGADDAFRAHVRETGLAPTGAAVQAAFVRARERGEIPDDAPVDVLVDALGGVVFFRAVLGVPFTEEDGAAVVRSLLFGTVSGTVSGTTPGGTR